MNPFDLEEQAQAIHDGARDGAATSGARGWRRSASTFARTTSGAWLETQLEDLDRWSAKATR